MTAGEGAATGNEHDKEEEDSVTNKIEEFANSLTWEPFEQDGLLKEYEYSVWQESTGHLGAVVRKAGENGFGYTGNRHGTYEQAMTAAAKHIDGYESWEKFLIRNPEVQDALDGIPDAPRGEPLPDEFIESFENVVELTVAAAKREKATRR